MKKILSRVLIVVVLLLVLVVAGVFLMLNTLVKKGFETVGPQLTKVEMRLGSAKISPLSGQGHLSDLFMGNPEGYKTDFAINVGDIRVRVQLGSVLSDTVVIEEVTIRAPEVTLEGGVKNNNLTKILENVEAATGAGSAKDTPDKSAAGGKKFIIKELVVEEGKIHVSPTLLGGTKTIPMPPIRMQNVGSDTGGVAIAKVTQDLLSRMVSGVAGAVTDALANAGKAVQDLGKETAGTVKDAAGQVKDAASGLKGLFQRDKK